MDFAQGPGPGPGAAVGPVRPNVLPHFDELALDAVGQAVIATDSVGNIIRWNREAERLYGWPTEEAVGRNILDVTVPEGMEDPATEILAALRAGERWSGTFHVQDRSGRRFEAMVTDTPVLDEAGALVGIIGVSTDLTEWRRLEEAQRVAERRFLLSFEHSAVGMAVVDLDGRHLEVNPALCKLLDRDRCEIIGRTAADFLAGSRDPAAHAADLVRQHASCEQVEVRIVRPDGSLIDALVSISLIDDEEGGSKHFLVQVLDNSRRKRAERDLRRAERRAQETLDHFVDAVGRTIELRDPYTAGHQGRVAEMAEMIAKSLGLDDHTIAGIGVAASIHDIGKIAVPAEILNRPGKLTRAQLDIIKEHPVAGYEILANVDFPWPIARMVLEHHERFDGSGYPAGLSGREILLGSRILAVADMIEAASAHRPYRAALGFETALDLAVTARGTQLDPDVVDAATTCAEGLFSVISTAATHW